MFRRQERFILFTFCFAMSAAFAGKLIPAGPADELVPNQYLIKFKPGAKGQAILGSALPGAQFVPLATPDVARVVAAGGITTAMLEQLAQNSQVEYIEPNRRRHALVSAPDDSSYGSQWALAVIEAYQAWQLLPNRYLTSTTAAANRIKIAVLDTGVDCTHPDFKNAGGSSVYSSEGGQLSATLGQAFMATKVSPAACAWQDDHGHGTHVAGTIAAATNNGTGVSAAGYPLEVVAFKVLDSSGSGDDATISAAIRAAADSGVRVISMSLGGAGYSQTLQDAINYAWSKDALVVAAAGNSSSSELFLPAAANHAFGVSATDSSNARAYFSNYGDYVDIAAPGVNITSTWPDAQYRQLSGTSMATPHVSAVAGLSAMATPGLPATAMAQLLQRTATSTTGNGNWSPEYGYGIVDARAAVAAEVHPATAGAITGQVVDAIGVAESNATVSVNGQNIITDSSGLFRFSGFAPGTYTVSAMLAGRGSVDAGVNVVAGADTNVTLQLGATPGTFRGTIYGSSGPAQGAVVQALQGGLIRGEAIADATGGFAIAVPAGTYDLRGAMAGYHGATAGNRIVAAGGTTTLTLTMAKLGTLAGVLRDAGGAVAAGADVLARSGDISAGAVTDASGHYSTVGLPAGTYAVTFTPAQGTAQTITGVVVSNGGPTLLNATLGGAPVSVAVTPAGGVVSNSQTLQCAATVQGVSNHSVTWTRTPSIGTISSTGLYTAPPYISSPQTVTITATSVAAPSYSGSVTITVAKMLTVTVPTQLMGGKSSASGKVTLEMAAPAGGATVMLSSSNPALARVPSSVTVPAGDTVSPAITIDTTAVTADTVVLISASYGGVVKSANLKLTTYGLSSLVLSPASAWAGTVTTQNRVGVEAPAGPGGAAVTLTSSAPGAAAVPAVVTVAPGSTSAFFDITAKPVAADTVVTITASFGGNTKTATMTVKALGVTDVTLSTSTIVGGTASTGNRVKLSGPAPEGGAVVTLASQNSSIASVPQTVTIAAGALTSAAFTIQTTAVGAQRSVTITAAYAGASKQATITVMPVTSAP